MEETAWDEFWSSAHVPGQRVPTKVHAHRSNLLTGSKEPVFPAVMVTKRMVNTRFRVTRSTVRDLKGG